MSKPTSDWDDDEQRLRTELENELDAIRKRHAHDPPRDVLVAARAGVLPDGVQTRMSAHLEQDAWSRTIVDGFEQSGADQDVDAAFEARLLANIKQASSTKAGPRARRRTLLAMGGLAVAATLLIGVLVSRDQRPQNTAPDSPSPSTPGSSVAVPPAPAFQIAFTKPDVKWSAGALIWRGASSDPPFMVDLTPAMEAYREGDDARAEQAFDRLAGKYPESIEVLFYQGVTHMLRGDFAGALAPLAAADRLKNVTFADDVTWFLGVAEQRSGQTAQSRSRLSILCDKNGSRAPEACAAVAGLDAQPERTPAKAR